MTKKYITYKDIDNIIESKNLQYLVMIGQRSNGKSYGSKELAIRKAWKEGIEFTYLRRRKEDIQDYMVYEYFADMVTPDKDGKTAISKITRGKYHTITVYKKGIYLANTDEEGKTTRGLQIGYAHALSGLEGIKSRQYPKVGYILFEEFIATGIYLWDEPNKLQNYVSTVFRDRPGRVIMIGNTISRVVPYFTEWGLDAVARQAQGSCDVYNFTSGDTVTAIGVFMCESLNTNSGMFFGSSAKMITGGLWDRSDKPKLQGDVDDYNRLYSMVFDYSNTNKFLMTFLQLKTDHTKMIWYVEPKTTEIQKGTRVISPAVNESRLYTKKFEPINEREMKILDYFREGKVCYSDNLTGTEFEKCVEMIGGRKSF